MDELREAVLRAATEAIYTTIFVAEIAPGILIEDHDAGRQAREWAIAEKALKAALAEIGRTHALVPKDDRQTVATIDALRAVLLMLPSGTPEPWMVWAEEDGAACLEFNVGDSSNTFWIDVGPGASVHTFRKLDGETEETRATTSSVVLPAYIATTLAKLYPAGAATPPASTGGGEGG